MLILLRPRVEIGNLVFLDPRFCDNYLLEQIRVEHLRFRSDGKVAIFLGSLVELPFEWLCQLCFVIRRSDGQLEVHEVFYLDHTENNRLRVVVTKPIAEPAPNLLFYATELMEGRSSILVIAGRDQRVFPLAT